MKYFEVKTSCNRLKNGELKPVTKTYIVGATSCVDADARIAEEVMPFGDFSVLAVRKSAVREVFRDASGDKWYRCKVMLVSFDDKGAEKRSPLIVMVEASNFSNAHNNLLDAMKGTISDYQIASIAETKIIDILCPKA